jgi:cytochrome c556
MRHTLYTGRRAARPVIFLNRLILAASIVSAAGYAVAQTAAPTASPSKQAIEARKAAFLLIGQNFKPLGDVLQGKTPYDQAQVRKRAERVAFLANLLPETFPDVSNVGEPGTRTKSDAWTNRADFDKKLKEFSEHTTALAQIAARESSASDAFKAAATVVAQDCKSCHDSYRVK